MPVWLLQRQMSSSEFSEWLAMERVEPQDPERSDWRMALSTAQIINHVVAALGAKGKQIQPKDLLLQFKDGGEEFPSQGQVVMKTKLWLRSMMAAVKKSKAAKKR